MKPVPLTAARICAFVFAPWKAVGRAGDAVDVADPAGVACLDRQDRAGGGEDLLRLDVADLAEVGRDARVLEHLGGGLELGLVGGRALEVERRLLDGSLAERALEERDVRVLVRARRCSRTCRHRR